MAASGAWIAGLHRLVRDRGAGRAIAGGLLVGWGAILALVGAWHRYWIAAALGGVCVYTGLLPLGVVRSPGWIQKCAALVHRFGFGGAIMGAGLFIVAVGLGGGASEGVPAFVPVAAGLTFFLAGLLAAMSPAGSPDTLLRRTLVALLMTAFSTASIVFPPSLLFMAPLTVLSWTAVVRLAVEKRTGRDPLAGWSDLRQLGLGCGVTLALAFLLIGVSQVRSCAREPAARPPAEAPPG